MSEKNKNETPPVVAGDVLEKVVVAAEIVSNNEAIAPVVNQVSFEAETEDLLKKENVALEQVAPEVAQNANELTFELEGQLYTFTEDCPEKLQIDGRVYHLKDLVNNEDILTSLVVGESGFIKKA